MKLGRLLRCIMLAMDEDGQEEELVFLPIYKDINEEVRLFKIELDKISKAKIIK